MSAENYDAAITEFEELENSIQDTDLRNECEYQKALALTAEGKYDAARKIYKILGDYKDSAEKNHRSGLSVRTGYDGCGPI